MPDPNELECVEAVALIVGGKLQGGGIGMSRLEAYAPDAFAIVSGFSSGSWGQAVFYHEGRVIVCDGCFKMTPTSCFIGEYEKEKIGDFRISECL